VETFQEAGRYEDRHVIPVPGLTNNEDEKVANEKGDERSRRWRWILMIFSLVTWAVFMGRNERIRNSRNDRTPRYEYGDAAI